MNKVELKQALDKLDRQRRTIARCASSTRDDAREDLNRALNKAFISLQGIVIPDVLEPAIAKVITSVNEAKVLTDRRPFGVKSPLEGSLVITSGLMWRLNRVRDALRVFIAKAVEWLAL